MMNILTFLRVMALAIIGWNRDPEAEAARQTHSIRIVKT